ncbi:Outer membrane protein beta-barrel domain-containing protein [Cyclobacterium lianum]|uniref:Outer membrane protein beta-barrel domain-containing protein n=1 Tax=Cyclobacterium lianum TaxID=388280 RepID=A0A1M7K3E0_9BACT|nr:outer membrane beta-barrel protein [Cyclobacterium lianum]SHM59735.1 Outer membrane protein beta-barrel domain-containing protein [Cyclobacterium lianum]
MKEQFDKKLAEKIKASFSNHEEPYDPQAWEKFSRAYFRPEKKPWLIYWPFFTAGIAASLLLFLIYFPKQEQIDRQVRSFSDSIAIEDVPFQGNRETEIEEEARADEGQPKIENIEKALAGSQAASANVEPGKVQEADFDRSETILPEVYPTPSLLKSFTESWEKFQTAMAQKMENVPLFAGQTNEQPIEDLALTEKDAAKIIEQWKEGEGEQETEVKNVQPFKLGLMLSPQASSNPVSGMNLGAGLMSEISLSNKFKLDFGLAYASQSLAPQNMQTMSEAASPAFDMRANSNIIDADYQLNFASLDIPVNLKYKVYDKNQTGIYLITGLSSMVYLEQNTVETIQAQSLFSANSTAGYLEYTPNVQKFSNVIAPQSGERNSDLAGLLNISFGYEYQLNNEFYLSFEPFYKLPLGGLTFADQQFSIGGVNLRMNFNLKNK